MNDWAVFTWFFNSFNQPLLTAVNQLATNLSGAVIPPATAAATIYIGATAAMDLYSGLSGNPILAHLIHR